MAEPNAYHETDGDSVLRRERGMHRVSNATRWTAAAAAAGTAVLGLTYTHLLPGKGQVPVSAQGGQQTVCVQQAPAAAATTAARGTPREIDGDAEEGGAGEKGDKAADDGSRNTTTVQPAVAACPAGTVANGLTPPAQAPSPAQQAPQTRTGAS